ncbi:MAG: hypothetical protein K5923_01500 [Clostridia bacterium]|nr:hypothetical protein [Clostridia bacterium]
MIREDKASVSIMLSAAIIGIIDVIAVIVFAVLGILIGVGILLQSQGIIIAAIVIAAINVVEIIMVPILLMLRKG